MLFTLYVFGVVWNIGSYPVGKFMAFVVVAFGYRTGILQHGAFFFISRSSAISRPLPCHCPLSLGPQMSLAEDRGV